MFVLRSAPRLRPYIYLGGILFIAIWVVLSGVNEKSLVEQIQKRGTLRVATLEAPLSIFTDQHQLTGYEYELTQRFANYLNVKIQFVTVNDRIHLFQALADRRVDVIASSLHHNNERSERLIASQSYRNNHTLVIYRKTRNFSPATSLEDLAGKDIAVIKQSAEELQIQSQASKVDFNLEVFDDLNHLDLLTLLQNGQAEYALIPSDLFFRFDSYHPELAVAFEFEKSSPAVWYTRNGRDKSLEQKLAHFFAEPETKTLIANLNQRFLPPRNPLNFIESHAFRRALEQRYEALHPYFIEAAKESGIDDAILAAVGYQESHWNEDAKSFTGVRGVMMLTQATAKDMGISDRTDAKESIIGGARYLTTVEQKIPERIPEPDRFWLAMAGYNIGFGHLEDARKLTQRAGLNPDKWEDVAKHLPALEDSAIYPTTTFGQARGNEAVQYVTNIRNYLQAIETFRRLNQLRTLHLEPL